MSAASGEETAKQNAKRNEGPPPAPAGAKGVHWPNEKTEGRLEKGVEVREYSKNTPIKSNRKNTQIDYQEDLYTLLSIGPAGIAEKWELKPAEYKRMSIRSTNSFRRNTHLSTGTGSEFLTKFSLPNDRASVAVFQKYFGVSSTDATPKFNEFLEQKCSFDDNDVGILQTGLKGRLESLKREQSGELENIKTKRRAQLIKWYESVLSEIRGGGEACPEIVAPPPKISLASLVPAFPSFGSKPSSDCISEDMMRDLVYIMVLLQGKAIPETQKKLDGMTLQDLLGLVRTNLQTNPDKTGKNYATIRKALDALDMVVRLKGLGGTSSGSTGREKPCPPTGATPEERKQLKKEGQSEAETRLFSLIWLDVLGKDPAKNPSIDLIVTELRTMITALADCTKHEARIKELEEQLAQWRKQSLETGANLLPIVSANEAELAELRRKLEENEKILAGKDSTIRNLLQTIDDLLAEQKKAEEALAAKQKELDDALAELAKRVAEIATAPAEKDLEIIRLRNELAALEQDYERSTKLLYEHITKLNDEIQRLNALLQQTQGTLAGSQVDKEKLEKLEADLKACHEALAAAEAKIPALDAKYNECEEKLAKLTEELATEKEACETRVKEAEQKCSDCDARLAALQAELDAAKKGQEGADTASQEEISKLEADLAKVVAENEALKEKLEYEKVRANTNEAGMREAEEETATLRTSTSTEIKELRKQLDACTAEKQALSDKIQNFLALLLVNQPILQKIQSYFTTGGNGSPKELATMVKTSLTGSLEERVKTAEETAASATALQNYVCELFGYLYGIIYGVHSHILIQTGNKLTTLRNIFPPIPDDESFLKEMSRFFQLYFTGGVTDGKRFENFPTVASIIQSYKKPVPSQMITIRDISKLFPAFMHILSVDGKNLVLNMNTTDIDSDGKIALFVLTSAYIDKLHTMLLKKKEDPIFQKCIP